MKQAMRFLRCCIGVVYGIPLSCGKSYVGQTDLNDRLREHSSNLNQFDGALHSAHCNGFAFEPYFTPVAILARSGNKTDRELLEAR